MLIPLLAVFDPDVVVEFVHPCELLGAYVALVGDPEMDALDVVGPMGLISQHLLAPVTFHGWFFRPQFMKLPC